MPSGGLLTIEAVLEEFDRFVYYLPDALVEVDLSTFRVTYMNRMAFQLLGYSAGDLARGLSGADLLGPGEAEHVAGIIGGYVALSRETGAPYERHSGQHLYEIVMRRANGSTFIAETQTSYVLDEREVPRRMRVMCRDVTARKRVEEERERLLAELQEAIAGLSRLQGLLPICAWCRRVRDDEGYWGELERYVEQNAGARISHGICPECAERMGDAGA